MGQNCDHSIITIIMPWHLKTHCDVQNKTLMIYEDGDGLMVSLEGELQVIVYIINICLSAEQLQLSLFYLILLELIWTTLKYLFLVLFYVLLFYFACSFIILSYLRVYYVALLDVICTFVLEMLYKQKLSLLFLVFMK